MCALETKGLKLPKNLAEILFNNTSGESNHDLMIALHALAEDSFVCKRFSDYPQTVLDEISKYDYSEKVFLPCTPLELSSWCKDDKIYLGNPRILHSLRFLEKNNFNDIFGIHMRCPGNCLKTGPIRIVHGKINNFCGLVDSIVTSSSYEHIASSIKKNYGKLWKVEIFRPFIKSSASYNVKISKLGINETVDAEDAKSALSLVLEEAWKNSKEKGLYRGGIPPLYNPETYLSDPAFIPDMVRLASSWPPAVGRRVRARPSNGMPGGRIGIVHSLDKNHIIIDFDGSKVKYNINSPRTMFMLDTDLT